MSKSLRVAPAIAALLMPCVFFAPALASDVVSSQAPATGFVLFGIPVEFFLFAATLIGVALFHHRTFTVAFTGLAAIIAYKFLVTGFNAGPGVEGLVGHLWHERIILSNLFLLLLGFAVLSRQFEQSNAPELIPRFLPDDWKGGLVLLGMIFVLSSFLDNIAAALIGGVVAKAIYDKVHIGYLAAIVAASNAGGSGSVVGDTTTTMMWIDGISPLDVVHAYIAAGVGFFIYAIPLSIVQQRHSPIQKRADKSHPVDLVRLFIVAIILASAIGANVFANLKAPHLLEQYPVIGLGVWAAIIITGIVRFPDFKVVVGGFKGTLFLLALVTCASLMPVEALPPASWQTALSLGFVSAVFDNIPLTALAIKQGGYDWGVLAYAVGFGGSMIWFGSSAGVALTNMFPEGKSVFRWLMSGWWVALGYVVGFFALLLILGWRPHEPHKTDDRPSSHSLADPAAGAS
jgi:Na+/H+ antiporter NhaD/arsenite permease-like protein